MEGESAYSAFKKDMENKKGLDYAKDVLISMLGGYVITFLGILILAFLLLILQITENTVDIGILVIYVVANLTSGFIIGKRTKRRKFLWGMVSGTGYFLILFFLSKMLGQEVGKLGKDLITTLLICVGSGTLGGMIS